MSKPFSEEDAYTHLSSAGFEPHQAAGIVGNLFQESSLNPNAVNPKSGAYGMAQYLGPRKKQLIQFAQANGASPSDPRTQLDFMVSELNGPESRARDRLLEAKTPEEAAQIFRVHYERPGKAEANDSRRTAKARGLFDTMMQKVGMPVLNAMVPEAKADEEGWTYEPPASPNDWTYELPAQEVDDPYANKSGPELFARGALHSIQDTGRALGQGTRFVVGDELANKFNLPTQEDIDAAKKLDEQLMNHGWAQAGDIAGEIGQTLTGGLALKGAGMLAKAPKVVRAAEAILAPKSAAEALSAGAAMGAVHPVASDESFRENVLSGATGGAGGYGAGKVLAGIVAPKISPAAQKLMDEGVNPTTGQMMGGYAQRIEDALTSAPIMGEFVRGAKQRSFDDFNRSTLNKVLKPIGQELPSDIPVGQDAIGHAQNVISQHYDDLLGTMVAKKDQQLLGDVQKLTDMVGTMQPKYQKAFQQYVDALNFSPNGTMLGETLKETESVLKKKAAGFIKNGGFDEDFGQALTELNKALLESAKRASGHEKTDALRKVNKAYALLQRVNKAGESAAGKEGVFTGNQLLSAVKRGRGESAAKIASGRGMMQDWAQAGHEALGQKVPDSGTPERLFSNLLGGGAGYAAFGPQALAGMAAGSALYSKPGQDAARYLMTAGRQYRDPIRTAIEQKLLPYAGLLSATYAGSQ